MKAFEERSPLCVPALHFFEDGGVTFAVDPGSPNWVALDSNGGSLLRAISGSPPGRPWTLGEGVSWHAARHALPYSTAFLQVHGFAGALVRAGMLSAEPIVYAPYPGRSAVAIPEKLSELWIQINNACNLACSHCLVSSGPGEAFGLPPDVLLRLVDRAAELGVERFYVTGGEPLLRRDLFELARRVTGTHGAELIVLTNATVLEGPILAGVATLDRDLVRFQVSIDGARPETNDAIRGPGTLRLALDGARRLADLGFAVSLTTVTTESNLAELPDIPAIVRAAGAKSGHLMWSHRRGRAATGANGFFPPSASLISALERVLEASLREGVSLDNLDSVRRRVNGQPGVKYDLGNGGWDSACVFWDGTVYPTAALAGDPRLACGSIRSGDLGEILETSPVIAAIRDSSVADKASVAGDPFRFLTGGGDMEHAFTFTGSFLGDDPYYDISRWLVRRAMTDIGAEKLAFLPALRAAGSAAVLHAMGDGAIVCGAADGSLAERPVLPLHSNCVLSFDVDRPRAKVREFYGAAADVPKAELCCTRINPSETAHIPQEVLDRFYGCGSPVGLAAPLPGETYVDLGSGAGIDVFIAAKRVGSGGRAIGVDMTDRMLAVALENRRTVAERLGYDIVDFREGFLESVPVADGEADVVTSNCVVNLSPDKPRVFREISRILKPGGRLVLSDIVSDDEVPPSWKTNPILWDECLSGALTQDRLLAELEGAGLYGIQILERSPWRVVGGVAFHSMTVRAYRGEAASGRAGHQAAVYLGPGKAFLDDDGVQFIRGEPREVSHEAADRLSRPPYRGSFAIVRPGERSFLAGVSPAGETDCC